MPLSAGFVVGAGFFGAAGFGAGGHPGILRLVLGNYIHGAIGNLAHPLCNRGENVFLAFVAQIIVYILRSIEA